MSNVSIAASAMSDAQMRAAVLMNEGVTHMAQQRSELALQCFNAAIETSPDFALAYYNRGILFRSLLKSDAMRSDFQIAMNLDPNNAEIFKNVGIFMVLDGQRLQAIPVLQRAIELEPNSEVAWLSLLGAHHMIGNTDTVRKLCDHLVEKFPKSSEVRLADAFLIPQISMSRADIEQTRSRLLQKLDQLSKEGIRFADPLVHIRSSSFYLPYQGCPNKEMAEAIAQFYVKACPELSYVAPHCRHPRKKQPEKLRVGFVSPSMHQITLNQFFLKLIEALAGHEGFEPLIFSSAPSNHPTVQGIKARFSGYHDLPMDFFGAREIIAREKPDILLYLEVGSNQLMYALPFARLAPVQCVMGGYPVTTGIPNMDYFLSSTDIEDDNAQNYYSEKLVLLDKTPAVASRTPLSVPHKTRSELGLPDGDVHLYTCPAQLFKLHPDMDPVFDTILSRDPKALILLFDDKTTIMQSALKRRFALTMSAEHQQRILFLPYASREDFMHVLRAVDVVMDSYYFSFGTIAYLAMSSDVPFVTWPGPYFCGRGGYRLFKQMEIPELMAKTHDEYVEIALKLAHDKAFYRQCAEKIAQRSYQFFDDYSVMDEFTNGLGKLYFSEPDTGQ